MSDVMNRRRIVTGVAVACGAFAVPVGGGTPRGQSMKETPGTDANRTRTSLHQEVDLPASPKRVYEVLLDSKQFATFTGMTAEIDPRPGGTLSMFGGMIVGRNVELAPGQRIVQAWRPTHWDPGVYSIVRFELVSNGDATHVVLDHTGFPEGEFDHLNQGWPPRYWTPLKKYLS